MFGSTPHRNSNTGDVPTPSWSRLISRGIGLSALLVVLVCATQRGWSQSAATNTRTDAASPEIELSSANLPASSPTTIQFVGDRVPAATIKASTAPTPAPIASKPSSAPPLAVADYENYIKYRWNSSPAETRPAPLPAAPRVEMPMPVPTNPKHLEPISAITPVEKSNKLSDAQASRDITFAAPSSQPALAPERPRVAAAEPSTSHSIVVAAPIVEPHDLIAHSELPAAKDANINLAPSQHVAERHEVMLAQIPETPKPQPQLPAKPQTHPQPEPQAQSQPIPAAANDESKTVAVPSYPESIPIASINGLPAPAINSNFLPANPEGYCFRCGVQCPPCGCQPGGPGWSATRPIPWEVFAQGEYVGPARLAHVPVYRLRVDDRIAFVYRLSGQVAGQPYRLNVRDRIQVQSLSAPEVVNREVIVQPDGTITLPLLGQVRAAGSTMEELGRQLDDLFKRQIKDPRITVTPLVLNSNLEELRSSVDRRYGQGGQVSDARVSPDGTIQLPAIGSVPAQGLTLEELEREVKTRYALLVEGLEVTPILSERAPRFIYVVGEVRVPGRFTMEGPTTLMQAIALAGSWNVGAQLNEVIVFRRDENWQLMATKVNIRSSLLFKKPCPEGEIWLRDSDIVLVPKSPLLCADDVIELVFTRGIYGVFPMSAQLNFTKLSSL